MRPSRILGKSTGRFGRLLTIYKFPAGVWDAERSLVRALAGWVGQISDDPCRYPPGKTHYLDEFPAGMFFV